MATPALRAIRRRFSEAGITFVIEPNLVDLARGGDWMDELVEWPPRPTCRPWNRQYRQWLGKLRGQRYDWAVIFPNSFRAAWLARRAGARRRFGYDRDGRGWLLSDRLPVRNRRRRRNGQSTCSVPNSTKDGPTLEIPDRSGGRFVPMPLVEYYANLVEWLGCARPGDQLELFVTADCEASVQSRLASLNLQARHPLVVLSPGARYGAAKCWPPERFAAAADRLIETERAAVIVTCGPGEEPIARTIARSMRQPCWVFDEPRLSLGELKSLIRRCDLLLGNDAGPRHLAKAFGVPVVTLFGPTHPTWTATRYPKEAIVRIDIECGPCQQRVCPLGHLNCMTGLSVDAVIGAARSLLNLQA